MGTGYISAGASSLGASGLKALVTYFEDRWIAVKRNRGGLLNCINKDASATLQERGYAVNIPIQTSTSSALLTDGNTLTKDDTTGSVATVTLSNHRYKAFGATELGRALAGDVAALGMLDQRLADIMNDIEYDVASTASTGFTTNTVGTYGSNVTQLVLNNAIANLDGQKAKLPRFGFLAETATSWGAFTQIANIVTWNATGEINPLVQGDGTYGTHYWNGVNWRMSQAVNRATVSSTVQVDNFILNPDGLVFASRPLIQPLGPGVRAENMVLDGMAIQLLIAYDLNSIADLLTAHCVYGYAAGEEKFAAQVKA